MNHFRRSWKRYTILIIGIVLVGLLIFFEWPRTSPSSPSQTASSSISEIANNASSTTATTTIATSSAKPTSTLTTPPPSTTNQNIGHSVGISAGGSLSKISSQQLNQELNEMVALGITWVRFDIEWGDVQYSSPTSSTWSSYDTLVNALVAHHLQGLGVILFTPQWARAPGCDNGVECPPLDPSTYATFAAEIAARYKDDGMHYWEIWNEPNNYDFWAPKTDCVAYTQLLKATYPAIKKADPDAIVITGGLAPAATDGNNISPTDFLNCIYNAGGKNYFDAVGDHPYTFPASPANDGSGAWNQMSITTPSLRSIMMANGDGNKKIWITEFGTPTNGPDSNWYMSEAQESQLVTQTFQIYKSYPWAGPLFWYTLVDGGSSTDTNENFFGLIRADGSTKPAYTTLQNIIAAGL